MIGWRSFDYNSMNSHDVPTLRYHETDKDFSFSNVGEIIMEGSQSQGTCHGMQSPANAHIQTSIIPSDILFPLEFTIKCNDQSTGKGDVRSLKRLPAHYDIKKKARVTFAISNVQATSYALKKELVRYSVKKCSEFHGISECAFEQGKGRYYQSLAQDFDCESCATLSHLARKLKAPFQDLPLTCKVASV